jgi:6,7-dimethyl-8-ribityllumazine synthase
MRRKVALSRGEESYLGRARIGVIRAEYNADITERLEQSCLSELAAAGVKPGRIAKFSVPGCFEMPWLARRLARSRRYDVLIALGAVIRGETYHFELVANECARGLMEVSWRHDTPVVFEVLAAYHRRDALRRVESDRFNKGLEAAQTALSLLKTLDRLSFRSRIGQVLQARNRRG